MWIKLPEFDWGPRPSVLIGKTSMKAVWLKLENAYYYGETSLKDPTKRHGKGILILKNGDNSLNECWWVNDQRHGRGRMIDRKKHIHEGEYANDKRNGEGTYIFPTGEKYIG